ncbi:hypothetical protein FFLO_05865 [Filobasidium floriforme]|uniref:Uncharacterized protein n=1 Tax=Filobasidium floriforme TaxID=5210 RepID=A0A8K0JGK5_9TREE|nr:uncharacterized protein HD553DRAFT_336276 [Filobasidium floriforme]KAG7528966.1 hypothetical protein FFLO_05865 [Filobasidium floriforme]KAH8081750.1 hypothetical protein HD553DRAFT_336276 [Filobasidium floriforme]
MKGSRSGIAWRSHVEYHDYAASCTPSSHYGPHLQIVIEVVGRLGSNFRLSFAWYRSTARAAYNGHVIGKNSVSSQLSPACLSIKDNLMSSLPSFTQDIILPDDVSIPGSYLGARTMPDGTLEICSKDERSALDHISLYRSDATRQLLTLDGSFAVLMSCHKEQESVRTTIHNAGDGKVLAGYEIGLNRGYKFVAPSVPYTVEMIEAMKSHLRILEKIAYSDIALLQKVRKSLMVTEAVWSVGESFLLVAKRQLVRYATRAPGFRELEREIIKAVTGDRSIEGPFKTGRDSGSANDRAIKYLAWAMLMDRSFEALTQDAQTHFDVESFVKTVLFYLCVYHKKLSDHEKRSFRFNW